MKRAVLTGILGITGMAGAIGQDASIIMRIEQDGRPIDIIDNAITLRRASFDVIFEAPPSFAMLVNASFEPATYLAAIAGKPSSELPGFIRPLS